MGHVKDPTRDRYPCGKAKPLGRTPEQRRLAKLLTGKEDSQLASSPLQVLRARGLVDEHQAAAAEAYHADYRLAFGKGQARISSYGDQGGEIDPEAVQRARNRLGVNRKLALEIPEAERVKRGIDPISFPAGPFDNMPRRVKDVFENLVVFERWPQWIVYPVVTKETCPEFGVFFEGLAAVMLRHEGQRRHSGSGPISDAHANALGMGKTLDELYSARE